MYAAAVVTAPRPLGRRRMGDPAAHLGGPPDPRGRGRRRRAERPARFAGLMLDRIGLIAPRLASLDAEPRPARPRPPRPLCGSASTSSICAAPATALAPAARRPCTTLLEALARTYRSSFRPPTPDLLGRIDAALAAVAALRR